MIKRKAVVHDVRTVTILAGMVRKVEGASEKVGVRAEMPSATAMHHLEDA
jgi:hypothetical protein